MFGEILDLVPRSRPAPHGHSTFPHTITHSPSQCSRACCDAGLAGLAIISCSCTDVERRHATQSWFSRGVGASKRFVLIGSRRACMTGAHARRALHAGGRDRRAICDCRTRRAWQGAAVATQSLRLIQCSQYPARRDRRRSPDGCRCALAVRWRGHAGGRSRGGGGCQS